MSKIGDITKGTGLYEVLRTRAVLWGLLYLMSPSKRLSSFRPYLVPRTPSVGKIRGLLGTAMHRSFVCYIPGNTVAQAGEFVLDMWDKLYTRGGPEETERQEGAASIVALAMLKNFDEILSKMDIEFAATATPLAEQMISTPWACLLFSGAWSENIIRGYNETLDVAEKKLISEMRILADLQEKEVKPENIEQHQATIRKHEEIIILLRKSIGEIYDKLNMDTASVRNENETSSVKISPAVEERGSLFADCYRLANHLIPAIAKLKGKRLNPKLEVEIAIDLIKRSRNLPENITDGINKIIQVEHEARSFIDAAEVGGKFISNKYVEILGEDIEIAKNAKVLGLDVEHGIISYYTQERIKEIIASKIAAKEIALAEVIVPLADKDAISNYANDIRMGKIEDASLEDLLVLTSIYFKYIVQKVAIRRSIYETEPKQLQDYTMSVFEMLTPSESNAILHGDEDLPGKYPAILDWSGLESAMEMLKSNLSDEWVASGALVFMMLDGRVRRAAQKALRRGLYRRDILDMLGMTYIRMVEILPGLDTDTEGVAAAFDLDTKSFFSGRTYTFTEVLDVIDSAMGGVPEEVGMYGRELYGAQSAVRFFINLLHNFDKLSSVTETFGIFLRPIRPLDISKMAEYNEKLSAFAERVDAFEQANGVKVIPWTFTLRKKEILRTKYGVEGYLNGKLDPSEESYAESEKESGVKTSAPTPKTNMSDRMLVRIMSSEYAAEKGRVRYLWDLPGDVPVYWLISTYNGLVDAKISLKPAIYVDVEGKTLAEKFTQVKEMEEATAKEDAGEKEKQDEKILTGGMSTVDVQTLNVEDMEEGDWEPTEE